ncbi:MAG: hypothetical protein A2Z15_05305 [Chloroflexi bacterium RBG_16_50_11]|nr:MAG: hypothetical protein A2Z15_05305 [Chloroflexi bacterium RBG_16_50_11]
MSDIVLGTIIGGLIGVIGSILGFIIQGYYSKKNTELQLESEKRERQITRLIEKRAPYLSPINEQQQSVISSIHNIEKRVRDLEFACGDENVIAWADPRTIGYLQDITNSNDSISTATDNIEMLRVRNSDKKLAEHLTNTINLTVDISKETMKLHRLRIKHGEGNTGNNPNKEISDQCIICSKSDTQAK